MADKSKKAQNSTANSKRKTSSDLDRDAFHAKTREDYEKATKAANKSARKK